MAVSLGKDQRLGYLCAAREQLPQIVFEAANHRADLAGVYHVAVELRRRIVHVLVHLLPALFSRQTVALLDNLLHDVRAALANLRLNEEDIFADIHAVDNSLLTGILADHVLLKVRNGALVRRCGQADEKGVEVFEHLAPDVIDGAVALVHDDAVEKLRRDLRVVDDLPNGLPVGGGVFKQGFLLDGLVQLLTFEDGIHSLDRADVDLHVFGQARRLQAMDAVKLGERAVVIVGRIGEKLTLSLLAEALGIDKEQDALHPAEL